MSLYQLAHVIVEQMDMCVWFFFGFPSLIPNLDNQCVNFWLSILHYRTLMFSLNLYLFIIHQTIKILCVSLN
jgi:hypothetical protein